MASPSRNLLFLRRSISRVLNPNSSSFPSSLSFSIQRPFHFSLSSDCLLEPSWLAANFSILSGSVRLCSSATQVEFQGPASIDYRSLMQEDDYHRLANSTVHDLQEKLEEYGDSVEIEGYDVDYGNEVLTLKLGSLGTYVINKQTPNRQIWMSSPVSGPSRFDWDPSAQSWVYRRTKAKLSQVLEKELQHLCGAPINLS